MGEFINVCSGLDYHSMPTSDIDAVLVNTPAVGKSPKATEDIVQLIADSNTNRLYLDSGGFQIFERIQKNKNVLFDPKKELYVKGVLNVTPKHIYEVAKEILPSVIISLDYPIPKCEQDEHELKYQLAYGFNYKGAVETSAYVERYRQETGEDVKLYIPLQCYNLTQMNDFLDSLKGINFEGISIPKRVHDPTSLALFLFHIYKKFRGGKLPDIHLLGTTAFRYIAILAYFARNYFDYTSLDATSWACYSRNKHYLMPGDLRSVSIGDVAELKNELMPCDCCYCSRYLQLGDIQVQDINYREQILYSHNWLTINNAMKNFYDHAETATTLSNYLNDVIDPSYGKRRDEVAKIFKCLNIIELMKGHIEDDVFVGNLSRMLDAVSSR